MPTYVKIETAQIDGESPMLESLGQQISDNFESVHNDVTALGFGINQNIRDEFAGAVGATGIDSTVWDSAANGGGTVGIQAPHTLILSAASDGGVAAASGKIRIAFNEEYIAVFEARVKCTGSGNNEHLFGFQDSALGLTAVQVTDRTDLIAFWIDNSDTQWRYINASGASNNQSGMGAIANWTTLKLVVTCSATAGNRKIQAYMDGAELSGSPWTTNLTASIMRPVLWNDNQGASATDLIDYCYCYFQARPVAA